MKDEMDILREVGTIAAAQASSAISVILGRKISLNLPSLEVLSYNEIMSKSTVKNVGIAVFCKIITGLHGEIALILDEKDAYRLMSLSYKLTEGEKNAGLFTEIGLSLMKEIGNIAIGAYTVALGIMLKRQLITSIPTLMNGSTDCIVSSIFRPRSPDDLAFLVEAVFEEPETRIRGGFCLGLTKDSVDDVRRTCTDLLKAFEE